MGVDSPLSAKHGMPIRTCIGCRKRADKADLLRVVGNGTRVVPDPQAVLPGRGAYLHPRTDCLDHAVRRRAFARALRLHGDLDLAPVRDAVAASGEPRQILRGSTG